MNDLADKQWEELVVKLFKKRKDELIALDLLLDEISNLMHSDAEFSDMEDYVSHINKNIHIPRWNRFPETNPGMLNIPTVESKYLVFIKPDFIFEAIWSNDYFYTFMDRDDGQGWAIEKEVSFWIPITYPTPY